VDLPETLEVPARPSFSPNPVGGLLISNTEQGVRILLQVIGELSEDVMVFGQTPCSSGRHKRRNVAYLGLLPPPVDGLSDITDLYRARYGEPRSGERVFIVTCQQKDGWKALERETSDIVPPPPEAQQATTKQAVSQQVLMHKGSTRDAQGIAAPPTSQLPLGPKPETTDGIALRAGLEGSGVPGEEDDAPG
jgi:hypothetical protein